MIFKDVHVFGIMMLQLQIVPFIGEDHMIPNKDNISSDVIERNFHCLIMQCTRVVNRIIKVSQSEWLALGNPTSMDTILRIIKVLKSEWPTFKPY